MFQNSTDFIKPARIIFSKRRTLSLSVTKDAEFIVQAPLKLAENRIIEFIKLKEKWILTKLYEVKKRLEIKKVEPEIKLGKKEIADLKKQARISILERLESYSRIMNLTYKKFRLSGAKSRWGSCSGKNTISINWRLVLAPPEVLDYVIIHELAHIAEKNHSPRFWKWVASFDLEFKSHKKWLKDNGFRLFQVS